MPLEQFESVLGVESREELLTEVVDFTCWLGFDTVSAMTVIDRFRGASEFIVVDNTPPAYRAYFDDVERGHQDPVMQHCKKASVPIIWNQETYMAVGKGDMWESQAPFGYRTGIAVALHLPEGRHFFIGVDRDQPLPQDKAEVARMTAELQLFAAYAQDAALRVLVASPAQASDTGLTPRELECLRWTMEGKTAWELGRILGISEQTSARHLNNAARKLGCANKHHAMVKALRAGLIR